MIADVLRGVAHTTSKSKDGLLCIGCSVRVQAAEDFPETSRDRTSPDWFDCGLGHGEGAGSQRSLPV